MKKDFFTMRITSILLHPGLKKILHKGIIILYYMLMGIVSAFSQNSLIMGGTEEIYSQSPVYVDGPCPTIKDGNGGYYLYQLGRWQKENFKFHGGLKDPFNSVSQIWKKTDPAANFWNLNGYNFNAAWAYPWIQSIYKITSNEWIGFCHVEKHSTDPPSSNANAKFSMAIGYTSNGGESWIFLGEVVKPYDDSNNRNIGGGPVLIKNEGGTDYFYMYFNEWLSGSNWGGSVARASVSSVISNARNGTVGTWNKYYNGAWNQTGLTGQSTILFNSTDTHEDAQYNSTLGKYLILTSDNGSGLKLWESTNGVDWSNPIVVSSHKTNPIAWSYYGFFVGDGSDDGFTHSGGFYIYWADHNNEFTDNGRLLRRYVSVSTNASNSAVNAGFEDGPSTQEPLGWLTWPGTNGIDADADFTQDNGGGGSPHSGSKLCTHWKASAYEVSTYQIKDYISNGNYTLKAWVKSSGGQTSSKMSVRNYGGSLVEVNIPASNTWTQIAISDINVSNNQCQIDFYSKASANQWIVLDDVEFIATNVTVNNAAVNPGFEADAKETQTPSGWTIWPGSTGTHADAFYVGTTAAGAGPHGGTYLGFQWKASNYELSTYQLRTGLPNGNYTLKAWVKSSGGQSAAVMTAKNYGGNYLSTNIPATNTWTQISISNINVTNSQCQIDFYSNASANQWIVFDDIEFFSTTSGTPAARVASPVNANTDAELYIENSVYPNPFNNELRIKLGVQINSKASIQVFDAKGILIASKVSNTGYNGQILFNSSSWKPGMYVVQIVADKRQYRKKIILVR